MNIVVPSKLLVDEFKESDIVSISIVTSFSVFDEFLQDYCLENRTIDSNGDGFLSVGELQEAMKKRKNDKLLDESAMKKLFQSADLNKDKLISLNEYMLFRRGGKAFF